LPLTLLAVADGHGGSSYRYSDVGSALACRVAAELVEEALASLPLGGASRASAELQGLRRWLAADFPFRLHERWLEAVRRHWFELSEQAGQEFTPVAYGTTFGLLLLAPRWWALAGLGDWDLVRIEPDGNAELLSQEVHGPGSGEVTGSLCQDPQEVLAGFRSWVWPLAGSEAPFALALSTDGIRKSCASDADFLALAAWLALGLEPGPGPAQPELEQGETSAAPAPWSMESGDEREEGLPPAAFSLASALDRISAEGCGDDVSVATVHWRMMAPGSLRPGGQAEIAGPPPLRAARESAPLRGAPPPASGGPHRRFPWTVPLALTGTVAVVVGAALQQGLLPLAQGLRLPWSGASEQRGLLPTASLPPLRLEVARLCGTPALVEPTLASRRSQVLALRRGALQREELLGAAERDPLGALIAAGFDPDHPGSARQNGLAPLAICPALRTGLDTIWRLPDPLVRPPRPAMPPGPPPPP
jgi:hypothetical protein